MHARQYRVIGAVCIPHLFARSPKAAANVSYLSLVAKPRALLAKIISALMRLDLDHVGVDYPEPKT